MIDGYFPPDYDGPIEELGHADGHHCYLYKEKNGQWRARCSCDTTWTYDKSRTMDYMRAIFESHLRYFNRPKMETL